MFDHMSKYFVAFLEKTKHCFIHLWITGNIKIVALPISAARIHIYAQSAHPDNNFWCLNFWIKVWHILHWEKITSDFPRSEASVVVKGKIGSIISDQSWVRPFLTVVGDFLKGLTVRCQRLFFHTESFRLIHLTFIQTLVFTDF